MNTVSILCPTRERPDRAFNYAQSVFEKADNPERVELLFYIDNDDPKMEQYHQRWSSVKYDIKFVCGDPVSVSKSWNTLARCASGNIFMMGNDDLYHETPGWDTRLDQEVAKFPDEIYCIWFNDKHKGEKLCTFPTVSRKWYETVGYFSPGIFEFFFNDTWVQDIGQRIGRLHYIPDVIIEHQHWTYGYQADNTTARHRKGNGAGKNNRDKIVFQEKEYMREHAANKLREVMQ